MIHRSIKKSAVAALAMSTILGGTAAMADLNEIQLQVVVGNHTDVFTVNQVVPFFEQLSDASDQAISAHTVSYTTLGLSGFELMDLLRLGTNDISWGVPGYIAGEAPVVEGMELPGLTGDSLVMFKIQDAYRDLFNEQLGEHFNARLMGWSQQPALQAYCRLEDNQIENFSLATMKGLSVRVHSTTFSDFAESMGAIPVTMPFADVIPALERGVIDCAITSPSAAYGYGIGQVANAVVDVHAGYSTHFYAMNLDTWNGLNEETQSFLTEQFAKVEQDMRDYTPEVEATMAACLTDGPCEAGEPSGMTFVRLSDEDSADLRERVESVVVPRWAKRAGKDAEVQWNATAGQVLGMSISTE